jgi:hypothetical protein
MRAFGVKKYFQLIEFLPNSKDFNFEDFLYLKIKHLKILYSIYLLKF